MIAVYPDEPVRAHRGQTVSIMYRLLWLTAPVKYMLAWHRSYTGQLSCFDLRLE
jgi:hypothetical protein